MRVKSVKFIMKSAKKEKVFDIKSRTPRVNNSKVVSIFLNNDLETIKIVYSNNKSETYKYKDISNLKYESLKI